MSRSFVPHISPSHAIAELTPKGIILGLLLGVIFAIGNAYLGLKIGITVSASIPAAVISMAVLRALFKRVTILENNIVQTIASVGEGLAAGVIFSIPALFLLGAEISIMQIFFLSLLGGILGVLFMIPLRRYIIVKEHGIVPFPEGTACAEILKTGEKGASGAWSALLGMFIGALYKVLNGALFLFPETIKWVIRPFQRTLFSIDCTPALLSVGYIIGPRVASLLLAGGALGWWVFIPLISLFGGGDTIVFPSTIPIAQMDAEALWSNYIRYIGAGAVAVGGLLSLFKIFGVVQKTVVVGFQELFNGMRHKTDVARTDKDIPISYLILGSLAIILVLALVPAFKLDWLTIVLLVILGFFFAAVTSITVGIVGSTSNPVSGMTITTLILTCLIFIALDRTQKVYLIAIITMSAVVNVAICMAATTSQDLKTGFLLGSTPRSQQIAELFGLILPAAAIGGTLYLLNAAYGFGSSALPAPQATLVSMIAKGIIAGELPKTLFLIGIIIGLFLELLRVPILPFAIGLYLPLPLSTAVAVGGVAKGLIHRNNRGNEGRGVLFASGLIAGDACCGVFIALITVLGIIPAAAPTLFGISGTLIAYAILIGGLAFVARSTSNKSPC